MPNGWAQGPTGHQGGSGGAFKATGGPGGSAPPLPTPNSAGAGSHAARPSDIYPPAGAGAAVAAHGILHPPHQQQQQGPQQHDLQAQLAAAQTERDCLAAALNQAEGDKKLLRSNLDQAQRERHAAM